MKAINDLPILEFLAIQSLAKEGMRDSRAETDPIPLPPTTALCKPGLYERIANTFSNVLGILERRLYKKSIGSNPASQPD